MPVVKSSKSNTQESDQVPKVTAMYTDGACSGNPGPGGWGAIAQLSNGQIHEMGGASRSTTNNRMEIQAAIEILRWFAASPQSNGPPLYTDSKYVQDGITKWIKGWKKKKWKTTAGKPVLNQDLWQQLDDITQSVNAQLAIPVQWRYVKGHAGNEGNERCDAIAREFSKGRHPALITVTPWTEGRGQGLTSATVLDGVIAAPTDRSEVHSVDDNNNDTGGAANGGSLVGHDTWSDAGRGASVGMISSPDQRLNHMIERLRIADELASNGYWVTTAELAHLLDLAPSDLDRKGERWLWRNWSVLKVRQAETPTLWQLERID